MIGIDTNDRLLALAVDGQLRSATPAAMSVKTGDGAVRGEPLWAELRRNPRGISVRHFSDLARHRAGPEAFALAQRELGASLAALGADSQDGPAAWLAVRAAHDVRALGELLSVARSAGIEVAGFVDSAAAIAAHAGIARAALVVDLALFDCTLTLVTPSRDGVQVRRHAHLEQGWMDLLEAWLALVADTMIRRTRFDPLHDGAHEQQLFDRLPSMVRELESQASAVANVQAGDELFSVELARDQLAAATEGFRGQLLRRMQELKPPGEAVDLLLPPVLAALPGALSFLEAFGAGELVRVPEGLAAIGASLLPAPAGRDSGSVGYLRRVTVSGSAAAGIERSALRPAGPRATPTHLLHGGAALPITARGIVIGRSPQGAASGAQELLLPEGLAGISRRHATLLRDADGVTLVDHSTYGCFVNEERVNGRQHLSPGDRIRIGTPGVELAVIAVGEAR